MGFGRKRARSSVLPWLVLGLSLILTACGGGGETDQSGPAPESPIAAILTGTAATGGPISGTVTLKDASASANTLSTASASDGSFSFDVSGLSAPFLLRIAYGDPSAPSLLYSFANGAGNANITPLTSVAARAAIGGADLETFFRNSTAADIASAAARMSESVGALQDGLSPLLQRYGVQGDLLNTPFTADHTGVDAMMDDIVVDFHGNQVAIAARGSGRILFSAPPQDLTAGTFNVANLDQMTAPTPAAGGSLYTLYCAGCHGALSASTKKDISVARVQAAIDGDVGGMRVLQQLSAAEMQSIVAALTTEPATPAPPPSTPPDGAALFAANCAGCHGALEATSKLGATSVRIQNAISGGIGGMGALSSLSAAEIQAIAVALAAPTPTPTPTPTPPDGTALYASSCAGCHGPLGGSTKQGTSIARLQSAISNDTGGMGALSMLSVSEVQAIVTALTPGTPTPTPTPPPTPLDGAELYASSCAGCHGPLASSTKAGASVARIQDAISNDTAGMGVLSVLSATDVQAIATALAGVPVSPEPPSGTPDGPVLYAQYCANCHGTLENSSKGRATALGIQAAIAADIGGMGPLAVLASNEIESIESALALIAPTTPTCGSCHAIPPALGRHAKHSQFSCASCHGVGYSATAVSAATHNNGVVDLSDSAGWSAATTRCANACHGSEPWLGSDDDDDDDDDRDDDRSDDD